MVTSSSVKSSTHACHTLQGWFQLACVCTYVCGRATPSYLSSGRSSLLSINLLLALRSCPFVFVPLLLALRYCPFVTVPSLLSLRYCPFFTVPSLLSLRYCPFVTVLLLLALCYCPFATGPSLLSICYCPFVTVPLATVSSLLAIVPSLLAIDPSLLAHCTLAHHAIYWATVGCSNFICVIHLTPTSIAICH